jgi:hypothetical protein
VTAWYTVSVWDESCLAKRHRQEWQKTVAWQVRLEVTGITGFTDGANLAVQLRCVRRQGTESKDGNAQIGA